MHCKTELFTDLNRKLESINNLIANEYFVSELISISSSKQSEKIKIYQLHLQFEISGKIFNFHLFFLTVFIAIQLKKNHFL